MRSGLRSPVRNIVRSSAYRPCSPSSIALSGAKLTTWSPMRSSLRALLRTLFAQCGGSEMASHGNTMVAPL